MKMLLSLVVLLSIFLLISSAPPTCYSRILSLSKEIMASFKNLQNTEPVDPCVEMLPKLYLDIHNYCVLAKLRNFVAYPACQRVPQVSALKEKIRSLYTIMISFCRRPLPSMESTIQPLELIYKQFASLNFLDSIDLRSIPLAASVFQKKTISMLAAGQAEHKYWCLSGATKKSSHS
ncbi:claudin-1 [Platysternon megacephalum]|uniref:Claudin-1 n=1 Tax=Platysternon megacephalum TaxID=55544 RepID=A0A4D9EC19_9SAUR|nr:claudin-1 [Platysternon megacephalum]